MFAITKEVLPNDLLSWLKVCHALYACFGLMLRLLKVCNVLYAFDIKVSALYNSKNFSKSIQLAAPTLFMPESVQQGVG